MALVSKLQDENRRLRDELTRNKNLKNNIKAKELLRLN